MLVLVTGGNGFIGSHVVKQLIAAGHTVRCTLRKNSNTKRIRGLEYETVQADVRDRLAILEAVNDCDAVIHCASLSNWKDLNSPELNSIILSGTQNLIDACVAQEARMIYVSSAAALGSSKTELEIRDGQSQFNLNPKRYRYAGLKAAANEVCEQAICDQNADIIMVHPTETYGPGDTHFVTASTLVEFVSGPVSLTTKGGTNVAHVEDVATAIVASITKGRTGAKYILGGENLTFEQIAILTQELCGIKLPTIKIPRIILASLAFAYRCTPFVKLHTLSTKYRYAMHYWYFDNSKTISDLGTEFRSAKETLRSTIEWLKTHPNGIRINNN